jgi:hypothetical protein
MSHLTFRKRVANLPNPYRDDLKRVAGISKRLRDANTHREALKPPKTKEFPVSGRYLRASYDYNEGQRCSECFEDFLIAIRGILPTWAEAYGINKDPQVHDKQRTV